MLSQGNSSLSTISLSKIKPLLSPPLSGSSTTLLCSPVYLLKMYFRNELRVLCPGAGLGRLCAEIASLGILPFCPRPLSFHSPPFPFLPSLFSSIPLYDRSLFASLSLYCLSPRFLFSLPPSYFSLTVCTRFLMPGKRGVLFYVARFQFRVKYVR
jgi:hypothetical protein